MANLEFQFNQAEVSTIIGATDSDNLELSIFATHKVGEEKGEIYLALQSCKATGEPDTTKPPPVACPVPPGWTADPVPDITHDMLKNCPRFLIKANDKKNLDDNKVQLLNVILTGEVMTVELGIKASFQIKNASGSVTKIFDAYVK